MAVTGATPALDGDNFMIIASGSTANYVSWPTATDTFAARFYLKTPAAAGLVVIIEYLRQ